MSGSFNSAKLILFGFNGVIPSKEVLSFVESNNPAGFLLLEENYQNLRQLKDLTLLLRNAANSKIIIAVDQEPGRVQRFKSEFPKSLNPSEYLKAGKTKEYHLWCRETAEKMAEAGVNCNLAPLVDLMNPRNTGNVLKNRSFGENPEKVAEMAIILIDEFRKHQIKTCAKHFPGLGSAVNDPHELLAQSDHSADEFDKRHFIPFRSSIASNVEFIMTTHVLCRELDSENPATYSSKIISILRKSLGFKGQVLSDDLYMAGAGKPGELALSAEKALKCGHNLIIISRDFEAQKATVRHLNENYLSDESFRITIDNKAAAIN